MQLSLRKLIPGTVVLAIMLLYFFFDAREGGFPGCPFYSFTGLFCPGCGSQRALSALLHGDIVESFRYNPLLLVFSPVLVVAAYNSVYNAFRGNSRRTIPLFYSNKFVFAVLIVVVSFGVVRNIKGFEWLAPAHAHTGTQVQKS